MGWKHSQRAERWRRRAGRMRCTIYDLRRKPSRSSEVRSRPCGWDDWSRSRTTCGQHSSEEAELPGIARALYRLGWVAMLRGDHARARLLLEEGLAHFNELDDSVGMADALRALGNVSLIQGEYANASTLLEKSLTVYR